MKYIAVIPARKGSKRLKNKNRLLLAGKRLFEHSINHAKESSFIDQIYLSTDCEEMGNCANNAGVNWHMRSEKLSNDCSNIYDVIIEVYRYHRVLTSEVEIGIVLLQPTSPLRIVEDIDKSIKLLESENAASVVTVQKLKHIQFPSKLLSIDENKRLTPIFKRNSNGNKNIMHRNGPAVLVVKAIDMVESKKLYPEPCLGYEMPTYRSIDIDTIEDFKLAQLILRNKNEF